MQDTPELWAALARSKFRRRFRLGAKELAYLRRHGPAVIEEHARQFIRTRLAPARPTNDGRQTPLRNHPVFIAQHATATCCRGCLEKWHHIPPGAELTAAQAEYVVRVIMTWLERYDTPGCPGTPRQGVGGT